MSERHFDFFCWWWWWCFFLFFPYWKFLKFLMHILNNLMKCGRDTLLTFLEKISLIPEWKYFFFTSFLDNSTKKMLLRHSGLRATEQENNFSILFCKTSSVTGLWVSKCTESFVDLMTSLPMTGKYAFIMETCTFSGTPVSQTDFMTKLQSDWDKYWQRNAGNSNMSSQKKKIISVLVKNPWMHNISTRFSFPLLNHNPRKELTQQEPEQAKRAHIYNKTHHI